MRTTTRYIGGQRLTLAQGQRYIAERPFLGPDDRRADVTIYNCATDEAVVVLHDLPKEQADAFIRAFNGEASGFGEGRVWL